MLKTKIEFLLGRANKKMIIAIGIAVVLVAVVIIGVLAAHWKIEKIRTGSYAKIGKYGNMMGYNNNALNSKYNDEFSTPEDAAFVGKIALVVEDLEAAKNAVAEIGEKNGGSIYSTLISYSSGDIKNGVVTIQVPSINFKTVLVSLKEIGSQIVQESTRKVPIRSNDFCAQPSPIPAGQEAQLKKETVSDIADVKENEKLVSAPGAATEIMPIACLQKPQDKGYVQVVFADYGKATKYDKSSNFNIGGAVGMGYVGQNMRENLLLILAIKSILLIVLIAILVIIGKKIIKNLRKNKNKPTVHIVRQATKKRLKVTRIRKR